MKIRSCDPFYSKLSDIEKEYFSKAIDKMEWREFQDGYWNGGRSTKGPDFLYYSENYTTERLYYQLQVNKEIPTDEEMLNESRGRKLKDPAVIKLLSHRRS